MNKVLRIVSKESLNGNHRKAFMTRAFKGTNKDGQGRIVSGFDIRIYPSGQNNLSCCVWLSVSPNNYANGSAKTGGYGYHKESAVISQALKNAGVEFERDFSMVGESAILEAIQGLADFLNIENWETVHA